MLLRRCCRFWQQCRSNVRHCFPKRQHCRSNRQLCCLLLRQCCRFGQQCRSNVRLCRKNKILTQNSFDIVAVFGNNVERCFDIVAKNGNNVEATFDIVAFDNVASTLLLVWTGLNASESLRAPCWRVVVAVGRPVEVWRWCWTPVWKPHGRCWWSCSRDSSPWSCRTSAVYTQTNKQRIHYTRVSSPMTCSHVHLVGCVAQW